MQKSNKRTEQKEQSRLMVLRSAGELFSHHGYDGVSLNAIADHSKVSKQNLLYHFESKKNLWIETVDWVFTAAERSFAALATESRVPYDSLEKLVETYFTVCLKHPAYVLLPLIEGINDTWRSELIGSKYLKRHSEFSTMMVTGLIDAGQLEDVSPLHFQNIMAGGAQLLLALRPLWKYAGAEPVANTEDISDLARTVTRLFAKK